MKRVCASNFLVAWAIAWIAVAGPAGGALVERGDGRCSLGGEGYRLEIEMAGFRFRILGAGGEVIAPAHPVSGLQFGSVAEVDLGVSSSELQEKLRRSFMWLQQ